MVFRPSFFGCLMSADLPSVQAQILNLIVGKNYALLRRISILQMPAAAAAMMRVQTT